MILGDHGPLRRRAAEAMQRLFAAPPGRRSLGAIILWWELRRVPYNLIVGLVGIGSLLVFSASIVSSGKLQPGEDAVEPLALLAAPILANVLYTGGWVLECTVSLFNRQNAKPIGPRLLRLGLAFSLAVVLLPAVIWGGYRLLQLLHLLS